MTYMGFHAVFILPVIMLLGAFVISRYHKFQQSLIWGIGLMIAMALLYATPWDNWLILNDIWTYSEAVVVGRIGYVPIEEYLFFILQPILTGLWLVIVVQRNHLAWVESTGKGRNLLAASIWVLMGIASLGLLLFGHETWKYLAMIGIWVAPILWLQWTVGGNQLWHNRSVLLKALLPSTIYLSAVDRFAIDAGIWEISTATSTGLLVMGLPIEEFLFFLTVNMMIIQGMILFVWVRETGILKSVRDSLWVSAQPPILRASDRTRQGIQRFVLAPSLVVIGGASLIFALPIQVSQETQLLPLLVSVIFLGLPHGALDHRMPEIVTQQRSNWQRMSAFILGYVALMLPILGLWVLSPALGFVFFILLTLWHWGTADLHTLLHIQGIRFIGSRWSRASVAMVRGSLPMLVPLLFFPHDYYRAASDITALFTDVTASNLVWLTSANTQYVVGLVLLGLISLMTVDTFIHATKGGQLREWLVFTAETMILIVYFATVPPYLAIGLYFCIWHAARHIARIIAFEGLPDANALHSRWVRRAYGRFMKSAMPLTLVSILFLVGLYGVVPKSPNSLLSLISLYLVLISALTFPHSLVVSWMDHVEGLWRT